VVDPAGGVVPDGLLGVVGGTEEGVAGVTEGIVEAPGSVPGGHGCEGVPVVLLPLTAALPDVPLAPAALGLFPTVPAPEFGFAAPALPVEPVEFGMPVPFVPTTPGVAPGTADPGTTPEVTGPATGTHGMERGVFVGVWGAPTAGGLVEPGTVGVGGVDDVGAVGEVGEGALFCAYEARPDNMSASVAPQTAMINVFDTVSSLVLHLLFAIFQLDARCMARTALRPARDTDTSVA